MRRTRFIAFIGFAFFVVVANAQPPFSANPNSASVDLLRNKILALGHDVKFQDAQNVAECAHRTAGELRHDYRVVGPPLFHNFLVNTGIRKRGLCFQWAEDLFASLDALKLTTLELHWAEARAGTLREHNCVVVTARGQPFRSGIILDCWRHSGHLYWAELAHDHYPWVENPRYADVARGKAANHHLALETPLH